MSTRTLLWSAIVLVVASVPLAAGQPEQQRPRCEDTDFQELCVIVCPVEEVTAQANGDGSITVSTVSNHTADLYRSEAGGDAVLVSGFEEGPSVYHDTDTTVGTTYTYYVVFGPALCAQVEVTAIPFFPSPLAAAGAAILGILAYVRLRHR